MVGGGSIFGKYLWRVETTELERTYSISVSLSLSLSVSVSLSLSLSLSFVLSVLVKRRMFVSRSEYHSRVPGKSRGSVGVIESVIYKRSSGMLIPTATDALFTQKKKYVIVAISAASGRVASRLSNYHRSRSPKVRNLRLKLFRSCKG